MTKRRPPRSMVQPDARLAHQLEIHKIELQVQNEELRALRAETEDALQRYREVFELAPIGYTLLEDLDTIEEINRSGAELLGAERAALVGKRFAAFVSPHSLAAFANLLTAARAGVVARRAELELVRDTTVVPVRVNATQLRRSKPTILLAFEDISEQRAHELELARSEHALREQARRKDEFLGMLSHELRNPLAPIRTSVSVLEMVGSASEHAREAVGIIARSSEHMTRLVDDLLDVTRITSGKIKLKREPLDLTALVRHALEAHAAGFASHGITVETRLCRDPLWVLGDPDRIHQIASNLLGNAEKFTPHGGCVSVTTERVGGAVLLHVRDTGIGIAPDMISQLGVPFVQAPQALDRSPGGLGLGLAIVRSVVELHGGSIAIRSDGVGQGAEIVVSLPEHAEPASRPRDRARAPAPGRRILLIEDNPDTARSLRRALELRGHTVEVAHDGRAGIMRAHAAAPEVVICDLGLPDVDGFTVARRLREHPQLRNVLILALTGYARPDDVHRVLDAGFDRHLAKPAEIGDLDRILGELPRP